MNWGFNFVGALFLLFPGLVGYAGFVAGSRHSRLDLADRPNSLASLMVVLFCALVAHSCAATALWLQEIWCPAAPCFCAKIGFDPNPYKSLLGSNLATSRMSQGLTTSASIAFAFVGNLILALVTGAIAYRSGKSVWIRNFVRPDIIGWALDVSDNAEGSNHLVTAYVVSKTGDDGHFAGYEGMVEKITIGEHGVIGSLVLKTVDRFVVTVGKDGVQRINQPSAATMPLLAISGVEIANVSFTTIDLTDLPGFVDVYPEDKNFSEDEE